MGGGVLFSVFIQHIDRRLPQERRDRFNHAGQLGLLASKYSLAVRGWSEDWAGGGGGEGGRGREAAGGGGEAAGGGRSKIVALKSMCFYILRSSLTVVSPEGCMVPFVTVEDQESGK